MSGNLDEKITVKIISYWEENFGLSIDRSEAQEIKRNLSSFLELLIELEEKHASS